MEGPIEEPLVNRYVVVIPTIGDKVLVDPEGQLPVIEVPIDGSRQTHESLVTKLGRNVLDYPFLSIDHVYALDPLADTPHLYLQTKRVPDKLCPRAGHDFAPTGEIYLR